ncbi:MAG: hypothetical protein RL417_795 [Pseudomonadota bacterium]|jgi:ApaG protein
MEHKSLTSMIPVARYIATTNGIKISVVPSPLIEESRPSERRYAFAYTVTIENEGAGTCQLIERHWRIFSAGEQIGDVVGPGVVGEQPILRIGEAYTYTSSALIHDPFGEMHGTYFFRLEDGGYFEAEIPRFDLCYGEMLH